MQMYKALLCLLVILCATPCPAAAPKQSAASQVPVWLSVNGHLESTLHVGEQTTRILSGHVVASDIDLDAGVMCLRTEHDLWMIDLQRKTYEHALPLPPNSAYGSPRQSIVASGRGQCAAVLDKDSIGIVSAGKLHITRLVSPRAGDAGELVQLQYVQATRQFLIIAAEAYALIPADNPPEFANLMMPRGIARKNHFGSFHCCSALSNDGRTLYASAKILDNEDRWQYAVAKIDVGTGKYLGHVLPMPHPESSHGYIEPVSEGYILLSQDGQWLYTEGESDAYAIVSLNLRTQEFRLLPGAEKLLGLSPSGKELIAQKEDIPRETHVVNASNGELLRSSPDEVSSVAHGNGSMDMLESASATTWIPSPKRVLACKDLGNTITDLILDIAGSAPNAGYFEMYVGDFSIQPKPTQCQTSPPPIIASAEALAFIKGNAASFDASLMPPPPADTEAPDMWQNYKNACREQAKDKGENAKAYEAYCLARLVLP